MELRFVLLGKVRNRGFSIPRIRVNSSKRMLLTRPPFWQFVGCEADYSTPPRFSFANPPLLLSSRFALPITDLKGLV